MGESVKGAAIKPHAKTDNDAPQTQKKCSSQSISSPVEQILFLQKTIGNRAVSRLMGSGIFQAKLRISQPGDIYEQEADQVAEKVMLMPEPQVSESGIASGSQKNGIIQRKCPGCMGKSGSQNLKADEEMKLQAKEVTGQKPEVKPETEVGIGAIHGGGNPLPEHVRSFFETRLGQDFSQVRVHDDAKSAESALAINARAFTMGTDVVFGAGEYKPETSKGHRLLAHELTHVMQQQGGLDRKLNISTSTVSHVPEGINATILRKEGDEKPAEKSTKDKIKINYRKARIANQAYAKADSLGWANKLSTVSGGKYKAWADLWKDGKYDEFADAIAAHQKEQGIAKKDIDGVLGLQTWSTIGGIGEAIAGIKNVYWEKGEKKSVETCYLATEERIKRGHKYATGKSFELPEDRTTNLFDDILKSIPNRMLKVDTQYRGAGAAGALVYAGIGEFVPESDIWAGKLRPGAALQVWADRKDYDLLQAGEIEEKGEKRPITKEDASFYGTSLVFVRYDSKTNEKMLVRHFGESEWKSKSDFEVWIAANVKETPQEPVE